jgi:hypothetical protein
VAKYWRSGVLALAVLGMLLSTGVAFAQGPLTNGANHSGTIAAGGELDLWTFTASEGTAISVSIGEVGTVDNAPFVPQIRLRRPDGVQIGTANNYQGAVINILSAPQTGTYTVVVDSADLPQAGTGDYLLTIANTPGTFVVPAGDQGGAMTNGANHAGTLHRADIDMWTFTASEGAAISVSIGEVGTSDNAPFVPQIRLRRPDGVQIGTANNYQGAVINILSAPQTGTYTVVVDSADLSRVGAGDYLLTIANTPGPFVVPTGDQGGVMTNGENHAGVIHRADVDMWTFTANEGTAISVSIGEVGTTDNAPFVPQIRLRRPDGVQIGSANNYQAAQINILSAPQTGTYTVVVDSADLPRVGAGDYLLTIANTPVPFVVPTGDQGGPMTNGANHAGTLHRADLDIWTFTASQGSTIAVSIGEVGTSDNAPFVPWIRLRRPDGVQIGTADNYQAAQINVLSAPQTGTYTVVVASSDGPHVGAGDYLLTIANSPAAFVVPAGDEGGAMLNGVAHQGVIHRADLDLWKFNAIRGTAVTVSIGEVGDNPLFVTWIRLRRPDGSQIATADNYQGAQINVVVPQDGTYTVVVTSSDGGHVGTGTYNLTVTGAVPTPPDTDNDTLPDDWETRFGLDPGASTGDSGADGDPDADGVTNAAELGRGTHPRGYFAPSLAEGALNAFFDVRLAFLNVGTGPARVWLRFLQPGGVVATYFHLLPPGQRWTMNRADLTLLSSPDFSTVVESDQPIVIDRTMSWDASGYGSHAETAVARPSTTWYLAEGSTSGDFALFYLLLNPNPVPVDVTVRYLLPGGLPPVERTVALAADARLTIPVDNEGAALASTDVSAVITATQPIFVERAMYKHAAGQLFAAGHGSAGVTAPSLSWFLAEGATGPFFDLFVLLANPNSQAATVTVDYLLSSGQVHTKSYVVPANGRFTIWVDDEQLPAGSGIKPLANVAVSTTVTSSVPIIVERTMWWPGPETSAAFWTEAHNSPGATRTGVRWALAEGEVGGSRGAETYLLIANTSASAGQARVTLYFEDATTAVRVVDLLPRSRTNVAVSAVFPEAVQKRFASVVESLGATPAQIVVERAMYTSPGGVIWAAGTNALATPLP